jgi:hypothetical protein
MKPEHIKEAHLTMGKIKECYMFLISVNNAGIEEIARVFGIASNQVFSAELIEEFKATGEQNLQFLTGSFLIEKGFKNLLSA